MSRGQSASNAHGVLDYLISMALLRGETMKSRLQIPLVDLQDEYEGIELTDELLETVLEITITTKFDAGTQELLESDIDEEEHEPNN
jgi:hypothetical protein